MDLIISQYMSWILSLVSVTMLWLMGNKSKYGPMVGFAGQILWAYYAIILKQYGLLVGVFAFAIVHLRNGYLWMKNDKSNS